MSDFELTPPPDHDPRRAPKPLAGARDAADEIPILRALAMAWSPRHRKWLIDVLRRLDLRTARGAYFGQADVDDSLMALAGRGLVARSDQGWQCTTDHRIGQFRLALAAPEPPDALRPVRRVRFASACTAPLTRPPIGPVLTQPACA